MQATISQFESEIADLKSRLSAQELETQNANCKFELSVSEQEKLKKNFESKKKSWADVTPRDLHLRCLPCSSLLPCVLFCLLHFIIASFALHRHFVVVMF